MQWKQSKGSGATYNNLIRVFEDAGYQECADAVRSIFTGQVGKFVWVIGGDYGMEVW